MAPTIGTSTTASSPDDSVVPVSARVSAGFERSLTQVARAILRLGVPQSALEEGDVIDRAGYWLLVRVSDAEPIRLSELAESVELDLSTVSRQTRDLVTAGLLVKVPDPLDGRASLLSLSERGRQVLDAVSEARRQVLTDAIAEWSEEERSALATGLLRLGAALHQTRDTGQTTDSSQTTASTKGSR
jgi:DNA-binding MarR family transcriptional regulator